MIDNPESLLEESHFDIEVLSNKIIEITPIDKKIYKNLQEHFLNEYTCNKMLEKFKNIL
jgi:hypothetical protein